MARERETHKLIIVANADCLNLTAPTVELHWGLFMHAVETGDEVWFNFNIQLHTMLGKYVVGVALNRRQI
jgi:hypothetical protein